MSSIGRIQAALAAATNEVTLAAANINFDFTLVKCEAPREFQPLGDVLSRKRKHNAEFGSTHITARRLGALFNGLTPETPELLKAYGSRVSEIAHNAKKNFQSEAEGSIFYEHDGFDGTSIWAAATSSSSALHVQLLACMLARLWSAGEAISIWFELVKQRRDEVGRQYEQNDVLPYATLSAATQSDLSRESLAEWDASARAWLRTADRTKVKQQDQLMLLIANVNIPVNHNMAVYQSVLTSWKSALESMERLVTGMPQATDSGPCLLALSSWHLYPDITVLGSRSSQHEFGDVLVHPGGKLTLGLGPRDQSDNNKKGVFWSLSLAHLNYYGRPPSRLGSFGIDSRKLTFHQLTQAVYGAFLAHWGFYGSGSVSASKLLVSIKNAFLREASLRSNGEMKNPSKVFLNKSNGLYILAKVAAEHLDSKEYPDDPVQKLVAFGSRKAPTFLGRSRSPTEFLPTLDALIRGLKGPEERIAFLRRLMSSKVHSRYQHAFAIRYSYVDRDAVIINQRVPYALASAYPRSDETYQKQDLPPHTRWAPANAPHGGHNEQVLNIPFNVALGIGVERSQISLTVDGSESAGGSQSATWRFLSGDPDLAAVFVDESLLRDSPYINLGFVRDPSIDDVIWCLDGGMFDMAYVEPGRSSEKSFITSRVIGSDGTTLRALFKAHLVYQSLPDATISPTVLNKPLREAKWLRLDTESLGAINRAEQRRQAFACIAYFDSGVTDVGFDIMRDAFAIAFEDSIYFSMELSCDPSVTPEAYEIKRISGNIGKPGLTILLPATNPMISDLDDSDWRVCSETEFDGKPEDLFSATSMHLSFTNFYKPYIQTDSFRTQDAQIFFQEAIISVHNRGVWIGDIDILGTLSSPLKQILPPLPCTGRHDEASLRRHLSLEKWEDVIEPRPLPGVIRAHGNWLARLAIVALSIQARAARGDKSLITAIGVVPSHCCICCYIVQFPERKQRTLVY